MQSTLALFACPKCKASLVASGSGIQCLSCDAIYSIEDGLYKFIAGKSDHGEFDHQTMRDILAHARENGWRRTVAEVMAPNHIRVGRLLDHQKRELTLDPLPDGGGTVLDFGCGYGAVSVALSRKYQTVVSLDGSEERVSFLNIIRQQDGLENVIAVCHIDPTHLPFGNDTFDAVVLVGVFEYLPLSLPHMTIFEAHDAVLRSFFRILKPGGKLLMHTKNRFGWNYMLIPLADFLMRLKGQGRYRTINYSYNRYQEIMRHAGFEISRMYWPFPGYQEPHALIDFSANVAAQIAAIPSEYVSGPKRAAFRMLAKMGMLRHIVPQLGIMATKPL